MAYYAEHFNTVEVNSTFYGQPRAEVTRAWAARTPSAFKFSVKLYQKFTHPRKFTERLTGPLSLDAPAEPALLMRSRGPTMDIDAFRRGIDPLASTGRLGARSPVSSKLQGYAGIARLPRRVAACVRRLSPGSGTPPQTWSESIGETLALLNTFGAAWVQIDEPKFRFSIRQNFLPNVQGFYYMRLHGRNAAQWWKHDKSEDRYNYLYSAGELKEFTETADAARQLVKKLYLYTNNHFSAKSVANAAMIKRQLGQPNDGEYPPAFLARYPELEGAVKTRRAFIPFTYIFLI